MTATWKDWTGGEPPTGQADIRLRSGREISKWLLGRPEADNDNNGGVIVAYREVGEAA